MIPSVDLSAQYASIRVGIDQAIARVIANPQHFILGPEVEAFEQAFARWLGVKGAVGVASGTAALFLALKALGINGGDEVITTPFTFAATAEAIAHCGARPVFVDIDPVTFNLSPECVAAAVTRKTRAILAVHLFGQMADMDALQDIAQRHDLFLVEDAAQAHGALWRGAPPATVGVVACYSFHPGKNLGAYGDGGAVTSNWPEVLDRVRKLRDHGRSAKYTHDEIGYGERLDGLQAAILGAKLPHLTGWTEARRRRARRYAEALAGLPLVLPLERAEARHVYHLYTLRSPERDRLQAALQGRGIFAGVYYPKGLHMQNAFTRANFVDHPLPDTDRAASEVLSLPLYPEMTDTQQDEVIAAVREAVA